MENIKLRLKPEEWISSIFSSQAAQKGAVVRRSVEWVEREIGRSTLIAEVRRRRYHMAETGGQFIIFCHNGQIRMIC
jgi:hypothetical protein